MVESPAQAPRVKRRSQLGVTGWVCLVILAVITFAAIAAPLIAQHPPTGGQLADQFLPASADHPLGTDENGNDILSRLLYGARVSLLAPLVVVGLSLLVGVPLALVSALRGGWVDAIIGRLLDLTFVFPPVLIAAILTLMYDQGVAPAVIAVAIAYVPWVARITRTAAMREREKDYIKAGEIQGLSGFALARRHLLPNISRLIAAQATLTMGYALVDLAALSFLGLGIRPPAPDWGVMVASTNSLVLGQYTSVVLAAGCILVVVLSLTVLGNKMSNETREV